jgi:hypothetical protein
MATASHSLRERVRPEPRTLLVGILLVHLEVGLLLGYALISGDRFVTLLDWRRAIYPFVWINVGLWALWRTSPAETTPRRKAVAGAIAVGYLVVLSYAGGLFDFGAMRALGPSLSVSLPPGFSPTLTYSAPPLRVSLFPYRVVGYLALAYLVYATVIDAASSAIGGVLGLLSCVSCSWPILATVATGVFGSTSAVAVAATGYSYGISTVVFVATVALLAWRPTV